MGGKEEEEDDDVVVLEGENGEEIAFQVIAIVEVDGQDYALLVELDDEGEVPEEFEVNVFRYKEGPDGPEFDDEVDEATFNRVREAATELLDESDPS
jgi:uncharacterized protein YrzB (UPF0473 family)